MAMSVEEADAVLAQFDFENSEAELEEKFRMRTGTCTVVPLHELTEPSSTSGWTVALESVGIKDRTQSSNKRRMLEENKVVSD